MRPPADESGDRGGNFASEALREHPELAWQFVDHPDRWQKARDLGLLALASYQTKEKRDAAADAS